MKRFYFFLLLNLLSLPVLAQPLLLSSPYQTYDLNPHLLVLDVTSQQVSIDSLLQHPEKYHFQHLNGRPKPNHAYWYRIELTNVTPNDFFLRLGYISSNVLIYETAGSKVIQQITETTGAAAVGQGFQRSRHIIPLTVKSGQTHQLYIYSIPNILHLALFGSLSLTQRIHFEDFFFGLYYGFVLIIAFYSLLLFAQLGERDNLIYGFWVLLHGYNIAIGSGETIEWFGAWHQTILRFGTTSASLASLLIVAFTMSFLSLRQQAPKLYRIGQGLVGVIGLGMIGNMLLFNNSIGGFIIFYLCAFLYVVSTSIIVLRLGNKVAWYLLLGHLCLFVSVVYPYFLPPPHL